MRQVDITCHIVETIAVVGPGWPDRPSQMNNPLISVPIIPKIRKMVIATRVNSDIEGCLRQLVIARTRPTIQSKNNGAYKTRLVSITARIVILIFSRAKKYV